MLEYVDRNDGPEPVPTLAFSSAQSFTIKYINSLSYDANTIHQARFQEVFAPWTTLDKSVGIRLPHPELGQAVAGEAYLRGATDHLPHSLTLALDTLGLNKNAGSKLHRP